MLTEAMSRLEDDGKRIALMDPEDMLLCKSLSSSLPEVEYVDSPRRSRVCDGCVRTGHREPCDFAA